MSREDRPTFYEQVASVKARSLPVHCNACSAISAECARSVERCRRMEDLAAAFAVVGLLGLLRQHTGRVVEVEGGASEWPDPVVQRLPATELEVSWTVHYLKVGLRRFFE